MPFSASLHDDSHVWHAPHAHPTGFWNPAAEDAFCAGGAWYDCRLNKWGDKVVACQKVCGMPPLLPKFWKKTMYRDCEYSMVHPDDTGIPVPKVPDLSALSGMGGFGKPKKKKGKPRIPGAKWEGPWRLWRVKEYQPWENDPDSGYPPLANREERKICCGKPTRKCISLANPNTIVRSIPLPLTAVPLLAALQAGVLPPPAAIASAASAEARTRRRAEGVHRQRAEFL
eukprot:gb/GFBE01036901.1/.p1 GENE.gb/GFBE01036901.1/~~gb/GFBE01036901.1/.p1  ORF type:complete len:228 (+),score=27.36 gb/GFBE01036901.1/:1-684(+)